MKDYKVSVVIPVYGKWELVFKLLYGLSLFEGENIDEVIIVDDKSPTPPPPADQWVRFKGIKEITVHANSKNLGFTKSSNIGLKMAVKNPFERHIVFLISSDVKINGRFIAPVEDVLMGARRYLVGNRLVAFNSGWNTFDGVVFDYLEGWFLATTAQGWKDLGYFDEIYAPHDYEDVDLSTTAKKKGYALFSLNHPGILHSGAGTIGYNPEREAITKRNREYFKNKWVK